jgi:hypothetical protein
MKIESIERFFVTFISHLNNRRHFFIGASLRSPRRARQNYPASPCGRRASHGEETSYVWKQHPSALLPVLSKDTSAKKELQANCATHRRESFA